IATVCLDNASNNDTFVCGLAVSLPSFRGPKSRVRCFAHIMNLVAKVRIYAHYTLMTNSEWFPCRDLWHLSLVPLLRNVELLRREKPLQLKPPLAMHMLDLDLYWRQPNHPVLPKTPRSLSTSLMETWSFLTITMRQWSYTTTRKCK
ncbi:hypothetical protein BDV93DRAFT_461534, partial [Ceratobasidium sp. AG-I]